MAVAIRCRSVKEAQASSAVLMLAVSLLPLVGLFNPGGEERWHLWVPALAQNTLMTRVLKGEALGAEPVLVPLAVLRVARAARAWASSRRCCATQRCADRQLGHHRGMNEPRSELRWRWCRFDELGVHELQNIYMARQQVFVLEQAVPLPRCRRHRRALASTSPRGRPCSASRWPMRAWWSPA